MTDVSAQGDAADDDWGISDSMLVEVLQAFDETSVGNDQPLRSKRGVRSTAASDGMTILQDGDDR